MKDTVGRFTRRIIDTAKDAGTLMRQSVHIGGLDLLQRSILFHDPSFVSQTDPILTPGQYGLEGFDKPEPLTAKDGTKFAIWYKPPKDKNQPVYVVFHGRTGHWGDAGSERGDQNGQCDRQYRLKWLDTLAKLGGISDNGSPSDKAGVIAVHLRGIGASAKYGEHPTENGFQWDMQAVIDFLREKNITPDRVVVAGESMGGVFATMFAANLNEAGHPPAVLGITASPISLREAIGDRYQKRLPREWLERRVVFPFDAREYFERLKPRFHGSRASSPLPRMYIAHAPEDSVALFNPHHNYYMQQAKALGITPEEKILTAGDMTPEFSYVHTSWNPETIVHALRSNYEKYREAHPPLDKWPPPLSEAEHRQIRKENLTLRNKYKHLQNGSNPVFTPQ